MSAVLAIDLGSTTLKAAVVDAAGALRASASEVLTTVHVGEQGVEQDPRQWWEVLGRCARRAVAVSGVARAELRQVAITTQYSSLVAVDASGHALGRAVMWMDRRGPAHRRPIDADHPWEEVHGAMPSANDNIARLDVILATNPEAHHAAAFVQPVDFLAARLTGTLSATQSTMFSMLVCDNRTWGATTYSEDLLGWLDLDPSLLPPLVPLDAGRGTLSPEAVDHLTVAPGAVVSSATIDSVTSAVGTGATDADRCGLIIGTTTVVATHLAAPCHDRAAGLTSAPSPLPGRWFVVAENGLGGKALDVVVNNLFAANDGLGPVPAHPYESLIRLAARSQPGANGVIFLPWLHGSMAPRWDRRQRGAFVNLGITSTRADLVRAVLEGVAANVGWLLPGFVGLSGERYDEIVFGGGGARSELWAQVLADTLGVSIRRLGTTGLTNARGAAMLALVADGSLSIADLPGLLVTAEVHDPDPAAHAVLGERATLLADLHDRLTPFYAAQHSAPRPAQARH